MADMSRPGLAPGLDQATQIADWQLERKIDRFENDGEEYPPAGRAADESTCSTSLEVVSFLAFSGPNSHTV